MVTISRVFVAVLTSLVLVGCATAPERHAAPHPSEGMAEIPGIPGARFYADEPSTKATIALFIEQNRRRYLAQGKKPSARHFTLLSLSGGGSDGAFGAGVLGGWTKHGNRPEFDLVTGISTGALIAPFAFLGPAHDPTLKEVFTTISDDDILTNTVLAGIMGGPAIADSAPMFRLISKYVDRKLLDAVAREHARGRRLWIGTTNIDAQRSVIWDMGVIASSKHPGALHLFRRILLASAAVPGFTPVRFDVELNGKRYDELHVDGGVVTEVFIHPAHEDIRPLFTTLGIGGARKLYILRNGKLDPEYNPVKAEFLDIAGRSVSTLIKNQGKNDLIRIYLLAKRDGLDYHLAYIPKSFKVKGHSMFDKKYMNALFDLGYRLGRNGYPWATAPPSLTYRKFR